MAFCGQCGLLLTTNTTKCPHCGAATDFDTVLSVTPEDDNTPTLMAHTNNPSHSSTPYTPPSPYSTAPGGRAYPEQSASQTSHPQSDIYPPSETFQHNFSQNGSNPIASNASVPNSLLQGSSQGPGIYQPPTPLRKTGKWPFILILVLIVALLVITGMFFALGSNSFARLIGANNTPIAQITPTAPPATTTQRNTPTTTQPSPTSAAASALQAQTTIQHYYNDINNHNYQDAYNLWVSNPDNYTHYKQGFAHTYHDTVTFGGTIPQIDGTIQINTTLQATEDASGGGTKVTTYQGYYIVGQQADGNWKIITAQFS